MRNNLPVTQNEFDLPAQTMLVSTTDAKGIITHCNHAFESVSGFSYDELMGQPHNIVRHPDMPQEAFKDMWSTVGRGRPWTGVVKNRRKNGDHYWVLANVTPIMENGKPVGYMSVRTKPAREQIQAAQALYQQLNDQERSGRQTIKLHAGRMRYLGWRGKLGAIWRLNATNRLSVGLLLVMLACLIPYLLELPYAGQAWLQMPILLTGCLAVRQWFKLQVQTPLDEADRFAGDMTACNFTTSLKLNHHSVVGSLLGRLWQIQLNMRAVVGDVREEIQGFSSSIADISRGSRDLSDRNESQASSLEQTAASMEQLASTVRQSADTALQVEEHSRRNMQVAQRGGDAIERVSQTMQAIQQDSRRMGEIISVIEGIAFQTNILALNAAVEAARAGEQGRGFAVVASEVRALAQRSANASHEIRDLIKGTATQIDEGASQMRDTRTTILDIVHEAAQVSELVARITLATQEQATGISQVNDAVNQLDSVTQQNAALGEESAAAVEQMSQRTETLRGSVKVFVM